MSAIAGICNVGSRRLDADLLTRMLDRLAARGPHARHQWVNGPVGLGHRLLHATPESLKERQPVSDAWGECWLVWDGRLDNREELIATLRAEGIALGAETDPEIALHAYRKWSVGCFQRMLGDFALALWDSRARSLICARDPIGVKPFYYHWNGARLTFASEVTALLADPCMAKRPNESMVADYLLMGFRDPEATFFEGVKQVTPGHFLRLEKGALSLEQYWDFDPAKETRYTRADDYVGHFRSLFREAVQCRLSSHGPVGVLLSGGIDSTGVTAMAQSIRAMNPEAPPMEALTLLHTELLQEEWDAIQALSKTYGVHVHAIPQEDRDGPLTPLELFLGASETLHYNASFTLPLTLQTAQAEGMAVLLTGFGADELLRSGETGFLEDLLRASRLGCLRAEIRLMADAYNGDASGILARLLWPQLPLRLRRAVKRLSGRQVPRWITPSFAERVHLAEWAMPEAPRRFPTRCQENSYRAITCPSAVLSLNWMDAASAAFSIECRHPFLDRRLIEFFLSIPSEVKVAGGYRKMFFQRAMQGVSAGPLRPREGTDTYLPRMAPESQTERDAVRLRRDLFHADAPIFHYVNRVEAEQIRDRYLAGEERHWNLLWRFTNLARWLEEFPPGLNKGGSL